MEPRHVPNPHRSADVEIRSLVDDLQHHPDRFEIELDEPYEEYQPDLPPMPCVAYDFLGPLRRFVHDDTRAIAIASSLGCWYEQCAESGVLPPVGMMDEIVEDLVARSGAADDASTRHDATLVVLLLAEYIDMVARLPVDEWRGEVLDLRFVRPAVEDVGPDGRPRMSYGLGHFDRPGPEYLDHARSLLERLRTDAARPPGPEG